MFARSRSIHLPVPGKLDGNSDEEVEASLPDRTSQGPHHPAGLVVRACDVHRLAVTPEADRARWRPGAHMPDASLEVGSRFEAQPAGVLDGAEDQVLGEIERSVERRGVVAAVDRANEVDQLVPIHGSRSDGVFYPQAVGVDEDAAHRDLCLLYTSDAADEEDSVDLGGR